MQTATEALFLLFTTGLRRMSVILSGCILRVDGTLSQLLQAGWKFEPFLERSGKFKVFQP
jgi:hypothetical protein